MTHVCIPLFKQNTCASASNTYGSSEIHTHYQLLFTSVRVLLPTKAIGIHVYCVLTNNSTCNFDFHNAVKYVYASLLPYCTCAISSNFIHNHQKTAPQRGFSLFSAVLDIFHFSFRQLPDSALFQSSQPDLSDGYPLKFLHGVTDGFAHLTDLTVLSLGDGYLYQGGVFVFL